MPYKGLKYLSINKEKGTQLVVVSNIKLCYSHQRFYENAGFYDEIVAKMTKL